MLKIENTSEYNKTTDWQVSKNLIEQRGIEFSKKSFKFSNNEVSFEIFYLC